MPESALSVRPPIRSENIDFDTRERTFIGPVDRETTGERNLRRRDTDRSIESIVVSADARVPALGHAGGECTLNSRITIRA